MCGLYEKKGKNGIFECDYNITQKKYRSRLNALQAVVGLAFRKLEDKL